jgi:hypothetical protein
VRRHKVKQGYKWLQLKPISSKWNPQSESPGTINTGVCVGGGGSGDKMFWRTSHIQTLD